MYPDEIAFLVFWVFFVAVLVGVLVLVFDTVDTENFNELPGNSNCIVVDWEENYLKGESVNRSGVYCLTDLEK